MSTVETGNEYDPTELVTIVHADVGAPGTVTRKQYETVWAGRGWTVEGTTDGTTEERDDLWRRFLADSQSLKKDELERLAFLRNVALTGTTKDSYIADLSPST